MTKKRIILLFLIMINALMAQLKLTNIRFNEEPYQIVFDIEGEGKPEYSINYDKVTRLLFLQVSDMLVDKKISSKLKVNDSFIEDVVTMDFGDGNGNFFITLADNVSYSDSVWNGPTRLVFDLEKRKSNRPLIVIDAGHGGKDPGAIRGDYEEKDITLATALKLGKYLEKDFNVAYTRTKDVFISLGKRTKVANSKKADLFVSIHTNASKSKDAKGVEVFYYSKTSSDYAKSVAEFENSFDEKFGIKETEAEFIVSDITYNQNKERSQILSKNTAKNLAASTNFINRGTHGANFAVLKGSEAPAILVELGFISNSQEAKLLSKDSYQDKMAQEMAESIREYFR